MLSRGSIPLNKILLHFEEDVNEFQHGQQTIVELLRFFQTVSEF